MPFPLGHTAIGMAVWETAQKTEVRGSRWTLVGWIALQANLPDIDILFGLLLQGNGNLFHRGPTHSLVFALLVGWLAHQAGRLEPRIPRLSWRACFLLVFSHVAADMLFTSGAVSLFWPLEVHWSSGHSGWLNIIQLLIFQGLQDVGIVAGVGLYLVALRVWRRAPLVLGLLAPVRRR
jgi:membrane-bound metal-dependent hydrolase YbcI (DUF457 family)